ncbi:MAG TPA: alpha/beta hydrolase [Planctomycetaceae bacterium]|nr:alpha/beta hydrolase [Planctomycetaceae bacterium]
MSHDTAITGIETPAMGSPEGCPPPLRCRQVAENWHAIAEPWSLPDSRLGTHGTQAGTGTPLYFLNAFGGCAELFTLIAWLLRDQHRCVLMDWSSSAGRHDHGSAWSWASGSVGTGTQSRARGTRKTSTLDDFADDILAAADHLGDRAFAVYGANFGTAVAARLAVNEPDRVTSVVLQGAWEQRRLSLGERALAWWYRGSNKSLSSWTSREEFQTANHRIWFPPLDPDRWAWFLEMTGSIPLALMAAQARAIDGVDLTHDYARLACPTMLLATEGAGRWSLDGQERIAAAHPRFRYEYLHSTGQHPYLTHPHRIAKLVKGHLSGEAESAEGCCSSEESAASAGCCGPAETPL